MESLVYNHSPEDIVRACGIRRLAPESKTFICCYLYDSTLCQDHVFWVSVVLQITPFRTHAHIHHECDSVRLSACCPPGIWKDSLVQGATEQIQALLDAVYPQLTCDISGVEKR
jgi:hypothetical protein